MPRPSLSRVTKDRWYSCALPLLEAIRELEDAGVHDISVADLAEKTGLTTLIVHTELRRLIGEGRYVLGEFELDGLGADPAQGILMGFQLAEEGARAVGVWPAKDPYEALLTILERRIAEAPDEPTRSGWRKVLDGVTKLGGEVGTNVLATALVELGKAGI